MPAEIVSNDFGATRLAKTLDRIRGRSAKSRMRHVRTLVAARKADTDRLIDQAVAEY